MQLIINCNTFLTNKNNIKIASQNDSIMFCHYGCIAFKDLILFMAGKIILNTKKAFNDFADALFVSCCRLTLS